MKRQIWEVFVISKYCEAHHFLLSISNQRVNMKEFTKKNQQRQIYVWASDWPHIIYTCFVQKYCKYQKLNPAKDRKSSQNSEEKQVAGYAWFEKVLARKSFGSKKFGPQNLFSTFSLN